MARSLTRRDFLRSLSIGAGAAVLAACGAANEPTQSGAATSAPAPAAPTAGESAPAATAAESNPAASGGMPIVTAPMTLSYWVETNANVTATSPTFNDISLYKELEKRSGIHLDFQHPPTGADQGKEQFNLMIASGKYSDIIETNWLNGYYQGGPSKALKDGVIVRLNDLLEQNAPNLKKALDDHPEWRKQVVTDEGDLYGFPFIRGDPALLVFTGAVIRGDWLEQLKLEMPTTIDEWHTVLTAFKTEQPGGEGTYAFTPWLDQKIRAGFDTSHAFIGAWGITTSFYQDNGTVKYGPLQPEYKEFLATMADWFKQGLIDPDTISADQKAYDAKMTNSKLGSGIMRVGGGIGKFMGLMKDKDPKFSLNGTPYPTLKKGETPQLGQRDNIYPGTNAAISSANQHVAESMRLLDYGYSQDGIFLYNFGVEGLSYTMVDGYPTYTDLVLKNPDKLPIAQSMSAHIRGNSSGPFIQDKRYLEQYLQLQQQKDAYQIWQQPTNEKLMPPVTPSQEESRRFSKVMTDINTRYEEVFAKILSGAQPLDSWDSFVAELKDGGIDEAIGIQQAALERYNKR